MIAANNIVYRITNTINSKLYFGITTQSLRIRWNLHKHNSLRQKRKSHLNNAIVKYGANNFKIELVKLCETAKEMYDLEIELIRRYNTTNRLFGYNNSTGGEKSTAGSKRSKEYKKRLSDYQKSRKRKPHSEKTKTNMANAARGRDMSKAVAASANKRRGVGLSEEVKRKLSKSGGKNATPINMLGKDMVIIIGFRSIKEATAATKITQSNISNVLTNRAKTAGGFIWQYQHKSCESGTG